LEKDIFKEVYTRVKNRNFKGYSGIAIKNSIYQFSTIFIEKIGAFVFTIILARLLMPELFGLYSLALSTILIFMAFSDMGIGQAMIRFVSRELGKSKNEKAKAYFLHFRKLKAIAVSFAILILILSARFISESYYQKPLFLALIAGALFILFTSMVAFLQPLLQASNNFKGIFYKEILFQLVRIILIPILIVISLRNLFSQESILFFIIIGLSLAYFLSAIFLAIVSKLNITYLKERTKKLSFNEKKKTNKFVLAISAVVLSGMFFGYIDMIMLGRFVQPEFIGYYKIALGLVGALGSLISFSIVFLPLFSRMKKKQLEKAFNKSIKITFLFSLIIASSVLLFAPWIINILYGSNYAPAINLLRALSLLVISMPIIALFVSYFIAKGEPKKITKALVFSTILNIILNYIVIKSLIIKGPFEAVLGVTAVTIFSRYFYLGWLFSQKKK